MSKNSQSVEEKINTQASRRSRANSTKRRTVWFGLGMFGVVGWSIAVPAAVGAFVGMWIDARVDRNESWTLMLLFAGLVAGCVNAWNWISRESEQS